MLYTNSLMNYKHSYDKNQYFFSYHLIFMLMTVQIQFFSQFGLSFSCFCQSKFNFSAFLDCHFHIFVSPNSTFQPIWTDLYISLGYINIRKSYMYKLSSIYVQKLLNKNVQLIRLFHMVSQSI